MKLLLKFGVVLGMILLITSQRERLLAISQEVLSFSFCDSPIEYSIGTVDPKFGVSEEVLLQETQMAADIWNKAYSSPIFVYNPNGAVKINLIYDERQRLRYQVDNLDKKLQTQEKSLKPEVADYNRRVNDFNKRQESLNQIIQRWNSEGGAPPDEYDKITLELEELKIEANELNALAEKLNQTANSFNNTLIEREQSADNFNYLLQHRPEEGVYDPATNSITVYFHDSKERFIHTMAHELGHALGLDHVNSETAIMNPLTSESTGLSTEDLQELQEYCRQQNKLEFVAQNLSTVIKAQVTRYQQ